MVPSGLSGPYKITNKIKLFAESQKNYCQLFYVVGRIPRFMNVNIHNL